MSISAGQRLEHYRILEPVGRGGMGEVWVAEDVRLKRRVAFKVLPRELSSYPERLGRFQREAEALAAVNHPNIVTIYSVGESDGVAYLTMELVEGATLREHTAGRPLAPERALELAIQLASALAEAHARGVVHRDLKPTNIMISRSGHLKVLDFGVAKLLEPDTSAEPVERPSGTVHLTQVGLVLGTAEYMSPEQAHGNELDFRSDQFSFGLVLYELLAGANPFRRGTPLATMAAISEEEAPQLSGVALPVRRIVERCLRKDPAQRYAATRDLLLDLEDVRSRPPEATTPPSLATPARSWSSWAVALLAVAAGVLAVLLSLSHLGGTDSGPAPELSSARLVPVATEDAAETSPAWDPSGRTLAYLREVDGIDQLFTRALDAALPTQVTDSANDCSGPFWARDGARLYYVTAYEGIPSLWRVGAAGGVPEVLVENVVTATLSPTAPTLALLRNDARDNTFYSLWLADEDGGDLRRLTTPPFDRMRPWKGYLQFRPDGGELAVWVGLWNLRSELWLVPLDGGPPRSVLPQLSDLPHPRPFTWLPDGRHLVYAEKARSARGGDLWIADLESGEARPLIVSTPIESDPAAAPDGDRLALSVLDEHFDVVEIPFDGGHPRTLLATHVNELHPVWSPDGKALAYVTDRSGQDEIWIETRDGEWKRPLVGRESFSGEDAYLIDEPAFSPDGRRIAYQTWRAGEFGIWVSPVAGGPPVRLAGDERPQGAPAWSPDGEWIAYLYSAGTHLGLAKARVGSVEVVDLHDELAYVPPRWSPDGRWIALQDSEGLALVSPDGSEVRRIDPRRWSLVAWDGSQALIALRVEPDRSAVVSRLDLDGGGETVLAEVARVPRPVTFTTLPFRGFSLDPGGQSVTTSIPRVAADIWWLESVRWPGTGGSGGG